MAEFPGPDTLGHVLASISYFWSFLWPGVAIGLFFIVCFVLCRVCEIWSGRAAPTRDETSTEHVTDLQDLPVSRWRTSASSE